MSGARLAAPAACAVPGCTVVSSHAGDFLRVELRARHEAPRVVVVCVECAAGRTAGLPTVAAPIVAALGVLLAAATPARASRAA